MDLEHKAILRLQEAARLSQHYYQKPLLLAYSGGKDIEVCLELCKRAGVPFEVVHSLTTADEAFRWWMDDKNLNGQLDFFGGEIGV